MRIEMPLDYIPTEEMDVTLELNGDKVIIKDSDKVVFGEMSSDKFIDKHGNYLFERRNFFRAVISASGKMDVIRYTPIHAHSGYSMLDGASKTKDMAEKAEYAMALTDHGNMFGILDFYNEMNKAGKKPILGVEAYSETIDGEKDGNHLLFLAETREGYHNLVKMVSKANANKKGRHNYVSYEMMEEHSAGVIATSACLGGEVSQAIIMGNDDEAVRVAKRMQEIFGKDNYFIEIQRHDLPEEKIVNPVLLDIAEEIGAKVVAASDSHYTNEEDRESQEILMALSTNDTMDNPDRFRLTGTGYHVHTSNEMAELYSDLPEVLDNTLEIAERCNVSLETKENHMPHIDVPEQYDSEDEYFEALSWAGFEERFKGTDAFESEEYRERLKFEMGVITNMGFPGYFIIMWDVINFANENNILVGPGRGSACGSLVAYVLQITDVDPIPYGLLFERFLNPDRYSMPDIDVDFPNTRREEIIEYTREKYGENSVARITTIGRLTAKRVVLDVAKVLGHPTSLGRLISDAIPDSPGISLDDAFEESAEFKRLFEDNEDANKVISMALQLEGLPRNTGMHACFTGDTLVTTENGLEKIEGVAEGTKVLTHEGRFKPVVSTIITKAKEIYKVYATNMLPLETTNNHPFYVREMTYIQKRINGKNTNYKSYSKPMWKDASDLEVGVDYLGIPINNESIIPEYSKYNLPFDNSDFWWVIGRYLGDGWTESHKRPLNGVIDARTEDRVIICCSKLDKEELFEIKERLTKANIDYRVEENRTTYKLHLYKEGLHEYLQEFGQYAHGKKINKDVINLPIQLASSLIDGYLSADGSYHKKTNRYGFKTVSKELGLGISQLINKVYKRPVNVTILPSRKDVIEGRVVNAREKYDFKFTKDTRKRERSYYDEEHNYIWTRVREVEIIEKEEKVHNLTVLDDSSYVVHGVSVHNCGVIIAPKPVNEYVPTFYVENTDTGTHQLTTQFDKDQVEEMGLLKMDFLGLKTLGVIDESLNTINDRRNTTGECPLTMRTIPVDDTKTYQNIQKGNTSGIFQLEGPGMSNAVSSILDGVQHETSDTSQESLLRLIASLSLYRPGPMDEIPNYIKNMKNPEKVHYETESMREVLSETHGVIVYQEQVMQLVRDLAGFSRGQSDILRKGMGDQIPEIMDDWGDAFLYGSDELNVKGCVPNGIPEEVAQDIWNKMVRFSDYAFNKSHAAGYSFVSARTGWLATHYPTEYYSAMMNIYVTEKEKAQKYLATSKELGINILPPSVNHSLEHFSVDGNDIRFGLNGISHVGQTASFIISERDIRGEFVDMKDFIVRMVQNYRITTKTLTNLILAGGLDDFPGSRLEKTEVSEDLLELGKFIRDSKNMSRPTLFDLGGFINQEVFTPELKNERELNKEQLLSKEREIAGFYITGHPLTEYSGIMNENESYETLRDLTDRIEEEMITSGDTFTRRDKVSIAGVITEVKTYYTKNGDPLKVFSIEDETGSVESIVFSNIIQEKRGLFNENDLMFLEGTVKVDSGDITFVVNTAEDLHVFKQKKYPEKFQLVGNRNLIVARKQYKEVQNWVKSLPKWEKKLKRIPLTFIQDGDEHEMKLTIPYSTQNQEKLKKLVGSSSVKPIYN